MTAPCHWAMPSAPLHVAQFPLASAAAAAAAAAAASCGMLSSPHQPHTGMPPPPPAFLHPHAPASLAAHYPTLHAGSSPPSRLHHALPLHAAAATAASPVGCQTGSHSPADLYLSPDRRSSSIAALRLKAIEHSAALGFFHPSYSYAK